MIQEKTELILGLAMTETYAQLSCCEENGTEPSTVSISDKEENFIIPLPDGLWTAVEKKKAVRIQGKLVPAKAALAAFFETCLKLLPMGRREQTAIMVTIRDLASPWSEQIPEALESLGLQRKNIFLQDFKSSFYYYTINQKKELWNADVALLEYQDETMVGYVLHIDRSTRPALVTVKKAGEQLVSDRIRDGRSDQEWDKERDRLFFELLKKVFDRRNVNTSYLIGDYFDRTWAERSFQYLCLHRHAFQGKNLYTKGACYAALERVGGRGVQDLLFMGSDIIQENLGMNMRVRGKMMYYPLVTAGINWYEAHHVCEFVPDNEKSIVLLSKPMTGGQEICHMLRLNHFPDRPNRATRLRMTVYFTSVECCVIEVEDLGFGGFYRSSGKKWKRKIRFQTQDEMMLPGKGM